jgi:hypothetical protein
MLNGLWICLEQIVIAVLLESFLSATELAKRRNLIQVFKSGMLASESTIPVHLATALSTVNLSSQFQFFFL